MDIVELFDYSSRLGIEFNQNSRIWKKLVSAFESSSFILGYMQQKLKRDIEKYSIEEIEAMDEESLGVGLFMNSEIKTSAISLMKKILLKFQEHISKLNHDSELQSPKVPLAALVKICKNLKKYCIKYRKFMTRDEKLIKYMSLIFKLEDKLRLYDNLD